MKREIVELDDLLLIEAGVVAKQQGSAWTKSSATALREYIDATSSRRSVRLHRDRRSDGSFSSDPEEIDRELMDGLDPYEGWSLTLGPPERGERHD